MVWTDYEIAHETGYSVEFDPLYVGKCGHVYIYIYICIKISVYIYIYIIYDTQYMMRSTYYIFITYIFHTHIYIYIQTNSFATSTHGHIIFVPDDSRRFFIGDNFRSPMMKRMKRRPALFFVFFFGFLDPLHLPPATLTGKDSMS